MSERVAIADSSYLVALLDERDSLHRRAIALAAALESHDASLVFLDLAVGETISVLARRCAERKKAQSFAKVLKRLEAVVAPPQITWVGHEIRRYYPRILADVQASSGRRNFNDSLTILVAQGGGIGFVVSFDPDFDGLPDLVRLDGPAAVRSAWG